MIQSEQAVVELRGLKLAGQSYPSRVVRTPFVVASSAEERVVKVPAQPAVSEEADTLTVHADAQSTLLKCRMQAPSRLGLMMVGWGGNNGSTLTASLLAHRLNLEWEERRGVQRPSFLGSLLLGTCTSLTPTLHVPLAQLAPFVDPDAIVCGGWDISSLNLYDSMHRAQVLPPTLKQQLRSEMEQMKPLRSYYDPSFIAGNQRSRADNVFPATWTKRQVVDQIRADIRAMQTQVDSVVVLWTANTERLTCLDVNVHNTAKDLLRAIEDNHSEISPSTLFAVACIEEGVPFINGSPQNTLLPGVVDLAVERGVVVGGDDFKSGQTKLKSVMTDFLVSSGIKPLSIVSYNHLGNNDGKNLAEAAQFRSKELSKSSVCDDMLASNPIMYASNAKRAKLQDKENALPDQVVESGKEEQEPLIDHKVVIEYVPSVGDTKRAIDEYECEIFMGGRQTFSVYTVCEDSLLAAPLMLDLVMLAELLTRLAVQDGAAGGGWKKFAGCQSLLSFMLKAPQVPQGQPVFNALAKQRRAIVALLKALSGLPVGEDDLALSSRFPAH